MNSIRNYRVEYKIITPIHIGTGEDISPFDYVIKDNYLYRFEIGELICDLPEREVKHLYELINSNKLVALRKLILEHFSEDRHAKYGIRVTETVGGKYRNAIQDIRNQLLVSPFNRKQGDFKPYIPGSSIKGAIRTAIVEFFAKEKNFKVKSPNNNFWELELLDAFDKKRRPVISKDPFRCLKVVDVFIQDEFIKVGEVLNVRVDRGKLKKVGIQMFKEVLEGEIYSGREIKFEGEILIDEFLTKWVSKELTKDFIIKACNEFYLSEYAREKQFFEEAPEMHDIIDKVGMKLKPEKDEFVLRVGRFSGVTAVTISQRKPHNKKWGTTKNLFEGKFPMGWMKVKFMPL